MELDQATGEEGAVKLTLTSRILALADQGLVPYQIADALGSQPAIVRTILWRARRNGAEIPRALPINRPTDTTKDQASGTKEAE